MLYGIVIGDWQNFDKDVSEIVRLSSKGNIEGRIDLLTVIIPNFAAERFGYKEPRQPKVPYKMNRKAEKIKKKIRGELRSLKKQHAAAEHKVRPALEELRGILRTKLKATRRNKEPYNDVIAAGKQEQSDLPVLKERFRSHQKSLALIGCCKIIYRAISVVIFLVWKRRLATGMGVRERSMPTWSFGRGA